MKKSYIIPDTVIVKIAPTNTLLSASDPNAAVNWEGSVDAGEVEVKSFTGHSCSVNWDDDWSE